MEPTIELHEHGFVSLVNSSLNGDLSVVNAARVSFAKHKTELDEADKKLIYYLVRNKHHSPLRHLHVTFRIKAPEFVMRQWYKHIVGISYSESPEPDHAWNEMSGRYCEYPNEFYFPSTIRMQSSSNKQGTLDKGIVEEELAKRLMKSSVENSHETYLKLLHLGVGREVARTILPMNFYTEVYWTASLQAILNFIDLRAKPDAQKEIRDFAYAVKDLMKNVAPVTMDAWEYYRL